MITFPYSTLIDFLHNLKQNIFYNTLDSSHICILFLILVNTFTIHVSSLEVLSYCAITSVNKFISFAIAVSIIFFNNS